MGMKSAADAQSQSVGNSVGYYARAIRTAGLGLEGRSINRFHAKVSRRLVSQPGRIQLFHVRPFGFVPVAERVRHAPHCDHGVATVFEDAKGGRRVVKRCERTV